MQRILPIVLILSLSVFGALGGCTSLHDQDNSQPLAVYGNLRTLEIAPVLVAARHVHEPRLAVNHGGTPNLFGEQGRPNETAGLADVGTHAETQALRYSVEHPDLRIIMTIAEGHYRIVARRSAGISRLEDLAGKRIATYRPTSAGYFVSRMLESVSLTEEDVTIVPLRSLDEVEEMFTNDDADAVAIWEPASENAFAVLGDDAIAFSGEGIYRELFNLNTTAAKLADPAMRQRIVAFVRSIVTASRMVEENPEMAWPLVAEAGNFNPDEIQRAWPHHSFPARLVEDLLDVLVEEEAWLARAEQRPARTREQLATLIDSSILEEALAGL